MMEGGVFVTLDGSTLVQLVGLEHLGGGDQDVEKGSGCSQRRQSSPVKRWW